MSDFIEHDEQRESNRLRNWYPQMGERIRADARRLLDDPDGIVLARITAMLDFNPHDDELAEQYNTAPALIQLIRWQAVHAPDPRLSTPAG